ncbi:acetyl-CoA carboxylase carboxyl transferase subunit alpha [Caminibacter mediatlanticus TB-2]|uniref:Acetyl-coenzyme A carboxylase carboxyl transferase subunit alpha n=1 Tax=Caminibacter mediatlanticus TB-2 TaxID=391592 RepID=A0ABX5VCY1_9BACT|nr:acetyl-CoA carboxylase carboxyl transferase subunit alpha [Caminibacter mediatlanticus]QCT95100.1 acetyl-CoA carboxylase carboxyl transferase subunit alpha [Caminibacter mediatlanticus TB-2]
MAVLDFEKKLQDIQEHIEVAKIKGDNHAVETLEKELKREVEKTFKNLTPYQKLLLARHPDRPHAIDIIERIMDEKYELHGDREFRDDEAIICFIGKIGDEKCVVIGEEKGRNTKEKIKRNFGMPHPEGYRKALRVAKLAEKFDLPILFLVDTPGAFPGIGAEERGQSEAIARNLLELSRLKVPTVSVVIGEGGSGGALAIGVADKLAMLKYSVFSVISPEGCAAILWGDNSKVEIATKALKISAEELKELGLIDDIIDEPLMGAHRDYDLTAENIKNYFLKQIEELKNISKDELLQKRFEKYLNYGEYKE